MRPQSRNISVWDVDPASTMLQKIHYKYTVGKLKSFSVVSEHRHEGKTTVAVLLARGLSEIYRLNVLLVDLNPEGDSLLNQHLKGSHKSKVNDNGIIENHQFPFTIFRMKNLEIDWAKNIFDGLYLNRMLTYFSTQYDLVIVDTMSNSGAIDTFLRINTDSNLVVSTDRSLSQKSNKLTQELILNKKSVLGLVFNQ